MMRDFMSPGVLTSASWHPRLNTGGAFPGGGLDAAGLEGAGVCQTHAKTRQGGRAVVSGYNSRRLPSSELRPDTKCLGDLTK